MKNIRHFAALLPLFLATVSCVSEPGIPPTPRTPDSEAEVRFVIKTPAPSKPGTRAVDTGFEDDIENVIVLIEDFEPAGGMTMNRVYIPSDFTTFGEGTAAFTIGMKPTDTPVRLIVMANLSPETLQYVNSNAETLRGLTDEELRETLIDEFVGDPFLNDEVMSMYGEVLLPNIEPFQNIERELSLLRYMARIELNLDLPDDSPSFVPVEAWIYRASGDIQVIPALDNMGAGNGVTEASVPTETQPLAPYGVGIEASDGVFMQTYLPESAPVIDPADRIEGATCIVVGGSFDGGPTTYYRLDFDSKQQGHPFGQILRNYRYVFNIEKVTAPGLADPNEAATTASSAIVVNVNPWQDNVSDIYFADPKDFFSIGGGNTLAFKYTAGETKTFTIRTSVPFTIKYPDDPAFPPGGIVIDPSAPGTISAINSERFSITNTISDSAPGAATPWVEYTFNVTTLQVNDYAEYSERVFFTVGTGQVAVTSVQAARQSKTVRIYSIGSDTGSFGDSSGGTADTNIGNNGVQMPLKDMLANAPQFNAGVGSFFEGLADIQFSNDPQGTIFTTANNASNVAMILASVDILVLSYGFSVPASNAAAITDWLAADPAHVLFVCADNVDGVANNEAFLGALYQTLGYSGGAAAMPWDNFSGVVGGLVDVLEGIVPGDLLNGLVNQLKDIHGTFPVSVPTGAEPFLRGLFGNVNLNTTFDATDNEAGAVSFSGDDPLPAQVLPLVQTHRSDGSLTWNFIIPSLSDAQRQPEMLMGVDPANRVVYVGESNLFSDMEYPQTTDGNSEWTRLMANTWAWAIDTVLK